MQLKENALLQSGKYRIIRVLGQGGFGITDLAENIMLGKQVAIKEFFPKDFCGRDNTSHLTLGTQNNADTVSKLKNRFLKEAQNISKLNHPGIVHIYDVFEENNTAYYVMDFIEGENLNEMVKRNGPLSEEKAIKYIHKVGDALDYIHSRNMTHFDVKPANIVVRKNDDQPILIDFGLSKQYDSKGDATSTLMQGVSQGYSPLELYNYGSVSSFSPQTDVYSLGATLYYLLNGVIPPHASEVLNYPLEFPKQISHYIKEAILLAMCPIASHRLPFIIQFIKLLNHEQDFFSDNFESETTNLIQNSDIKINGHDAVDLGLSVLWASKDIGATEANKRGDSFLWGDPDGTKTRKVRNSVLSRWFSGGPKSNNISGSTQYDTATSLWGKKWRMPTIAEVQELFNMCQIIGVEGSHIELMGPSGNSIVLDDRWHWTSESPRGTVQPFCWIADGNYIYFNLPNLIGKNWSELYFPIRPVANK